jgi:hypothetical protein
MAKWLVVLLRKLTRDNPLLEPPKLDGVKIRLSNAGFTIRNRKTTPKSGWFFRSCFEGG